MCSRTFFYATLIIVMSVERMALARQYYFSAAGNDLTGDGSRAAPFQTIDLLNRLALQPGDRVLFRAGDTFAGPILLDANDSATNADGVMRDKPIRFLSFGHGNRPIISSPHGDGLHATDFGGIRIKHLEFAGMSDVDRITDAANTMTGLLFENSNSSVQQHRIILDDLVVHGFGEAGIDLRAVDPATTSGGFADVRILRSEIYSNGRSGIMSSVRSSSGRVVDGSLYDFQSRAHENFFVRMNVVHHNYGKRGGGVSGNGIVLAQVATALVARNVAHHNGGVAGGGGVAIWTWESDQVRIESNEAYSNDSFDGRDGGAFDLDGGTRNGVLHYNYAHGNDGAAFGLFEFAYASPMRDNVIRYNVSEDDGEGVSVWGNSNGDGAAADSLFYNNTVVHARGPAAHFFGSVSRIGVYNSIFLGSGGQALVLLDDVHGSAGGSTPDVAMLHNAYWSGNDPFLIAWGGVSYASLSQWSAATSQEAAGGVGVGLQTAPGLTGPFDGGETLSDPRLLPSLSAYQLGSGSSLIDTGTAVANLPLAVALGLTDIGKQDFFANELPQAGAFDIGAHERR